MSSEEVELTEAGTPEDLPAPVCFREISFFVIYEFGRVLNVF